MAQYAAVNSLTILALLIGVVCLLGGAELLVKGAATIASKLGIAPVVIGLTVVAFGTSAPELAVSVSAAFSGNADVAFGNVVGSNIGNILLILGASAVVGGLAVQQRIIRFDIPLLIVVSVVALLMSLDNNIGRIDGIILFTGVVVYVGWLVREARRERTDVIDEYTESVDALEGAALERPLWFNLALVSAGLVVLVLGSQLLVNGATDIAESAGVSDLVIGLTVVAIGTSLPELATSILAAVRGQRDIAVGNVIGSNLFNLMSVLGLTSIVSSDGIPVSDVSLRLDFPVMLAATIVLVPIVWNGFQIKRWEGFVLISFYAAYAAYLVLDASDSSAADVVGPAALIVAPLVVMTFAVTGFQGWRRHRAASVVDPDR
ncbi:MAG TPA: calcium/sodium antiporter [Ilumatobacteraceae bacterium]|nr:calcium/sodium antiporter [Ilumatobacteraceae bacterium]